MIFFYFTEAFRSINSARTSFILSTVSLTISVLLILFSLITLKVSEFYTSSLKSNIKINLFLKDSVDESNNTDILAELQKKIYADTVEFISKEAAAEQFIEETGEDFRNILEYNPLPASFVLRVSEKYANADSLNFIIKDLSGFDWVEEVVFREGFIYRLINYINSFKIYLFGATIIVCLIALYLVYATVRLIIHSRMKEFETMKLVGAKLSTIKIPVILNGLMAGILSGLLSFLLFSLFQNQINSIEALIKLMNSYRLEFFLVIFVTGPLLVLIVSVFTLRKVSLRI